MLKKIEEKLIFISSSLGKKQRKISNFMLPMCFSIGLIFKSRIAASCDTVDDGHFSECVCTPAQQPVA